MTFVLVAGGAIACSSSSEEGETDDDALESDSSGLDIFEPDTSAVEAGD